MGKKRSGLTLFRLKESRNLTKKLYPRWCWLLGAGGRASRTTGHFEIGGRISRRRRDEEKHNRRGDGVCGNVGPLPARALRFFSLALPLPPFEAAARERRWSRRRGDRFPGTPTTTRDRACPTPCPFHFLSSLHAIPKDRHKHQSPRSILIFEFLKFTREKGHKWRFLPVSQR